jgi:thiol-disulfide isomerase/thioredoxin
MEAFTGYLEEGSMLFVNVGWCGHCTRARPILEQLAGQLGGALPVYDVDGDQWKTFLKQKFGARAPASYPTILFLSKDGEAITFTEERTLQNLLKFACLNAGSGRGTIQACNA